MTVKVSRSPLKKDLARPAIIIALPDPVAMGPRLCEGELVDANDALGTNPFCTVEEVIDAVGVAGVDSELDS